MFDRHAILKNHYVAQLRKEWRWDKIVRDCILNAEPSDDGDGYTGYCWLGTFYIKPSGKVYAPWTTNQTRSDVTRDEAWFDALEQVADEHGLFVGGPDGADDIYVGRCINEDEYNANFTKSA